MVLLYIYEEAQVCVPVSTLLKMSKPGDVGGTSGVKGAPQGMRAPVSEPEAKELLKPIVFGNYQRHFKIFTTVVSAAMAYYLVFNHDFGPKRHVFTWVRGKPLKLRML